MSIPLVMSQTGPVPTSMVSLNTALIQAVSATNPDYTANLPGSLIEDLSSTATGALYTIDQARIDAVNNVTPYGANPYVLSQLGAQAGIPQGQPYNTSVYITFTGQAGYVVAAGTIVSDGTNQYTTQASAIIPTGLTTAPVYCVSSSSGSWAVPAGSVTTVLTSVPSGYTLTCTNPLAGIPGGAAEPVESYRSRVLTAGQVTAQGTAAFIRTLVSAVPGVTPRLVSVLQVSGGWEVICGGGDPYEVAGAIYLGVLDLSSIVGSVTTARNIATTITDYPNTYNIVFVNPPNQVVTIAATWNTTLTTFSSGAQVNALAAPALAAYVNSITVGQPINELEMAYVFQESVASVLPAQYLTTLTFVVTINGTITAPSAGTSIIPGDTESYFSCAANAVTVTQ